MKFAEHLGAHITPEWRKQYIQYEVMKDMLYAAVEQAPSAEVTDIEAIEGYFARFDESFFQFCDKELLKINTFFSEKLAEATRKFANLQSDLTAAESVPETSTRRSMRRRKSSTHAAVYKNTDKEKAQSAKKLHDIKLAFSEFYLSLVLLQNYQTLNFTGFRKILKKHDKLLQTDRGMRWRETYVESAGFYTSKKVDHLIKETENVFTQKLEAGDRQKAMKRLRVPPLGERELKSWVTFRVGLFSGVVVVLVSVAVLSAIFRPPRADWMAALQMYRGSFLVMFWMFLMGINTYGWRSSGVNHVLIFELDPRDHLTYQQLLEMAAGLGVIATLSLLAYLFSDVHPTLEKFGILNPLCICVFFVIYLLNPLHIFHFKARRWVLRILFRIVTAPFHHVGFADFWLADQLNSLGVVLLDLEYMVCCFVTQVNWAAMFGHADASTPVWLEGECGKVSYAVRPIIACLPAWFRFAQCLRRYRDTRLVFPHIVNAGKYSTTFFVILFSSLHTYYYEKFQQQNQVFFILWILAAIASTCYTFTWDIKMDWGLLDKNAGENRFLREEMVYAYKGYYYFAIVEDFLLRFAWIVSITMTIGSNTSDDYGDDKTRHTRGQLVKTVLVSLEVFRRFVWNFFRLENEHLNNCGQFRAVRDISIAPIDANDQALLERMMDEEDGVNNRNKGEKVKLLGNTSRLKRNLTRIWVHADEEEEENRHL